MAWEGEIASPEYAYNTQLDGSQSGPGDTKPKSDVATRPPPQRLFLSRKLLFPSSISPFTPLTKPPSTLKTTFTMSDEQVRYFPHYPLSTPFSPSPIRLAGLSVSPASFATPLFTSRTPSRPSQDEPSKLTRN